MRMLGVLDYRTANARAENQLRSGRDRNDSDTKTAYGHALTNGKVGRR